MIGSIHWASMHNSVWFLAYMLCVILVVYIYYTTSRIIKELVYGPRQQMTLTKSGQSIRLIKSVLLGIGLFCLFLTLLQPQWNEKEELVEQQGRDVIIALDVSRSMLAEDVKPNRLAFAKAKIKQLVTHLNSERVGLILFAGDAFVHCPLTQDMHAFGQFLDQVDANTISSGTTALDKALSRAIQVYASMPQRKHSLVIAFTDGEDFSSNLSSLKQQAKNLGMHLFTVGVGTQEGAPVPIVNKEGAKVGYEKEADGAVVISRLNQDILENLALDIGGTYVHATPGSDEDILNVVNQVEQFEKESFDQTAVTGLEEKYYYCVAISFICYLIEWLL